MLNPLSVFIDNASSLLDLGRDAGLVIADNKLALFMECKQRLQFLRNLLQRARIVDFAQEWLLKLSDDIRALDARLHALPPDRRGGNVRTIPNELVSEQDRTAVALDAAAALILYGITS